MRNLQVNIKLIEQPLNGDSFSFTVKKNGQNIIYDTTGFNSVNKTFTNSTDLTAGRIVRLNGQLAYDNQNFKSFNGNVHSITPFQGDLLVVGAFTQYDGTTTSQLVRLSTTGDLIATYGTFTGTINVVKVSSIDSKIYVGGNFTSTLGNYLLRFNSDGTSDTTYNNFVGQGFNAQVFDIAFTYQNKIAVGGAFTSYQGFTAQKYLTHLNPDGSINTLWGTSRPNDWVKSLLVDGVRLWVGGLFTSWNGSGNALLNQVNMISGTVYNPNFNFGGDEINDLMKVGNYLYIAGDFSGLLGSTRGNLAKVYVGVDSTETPTLDAVFDTSTSTNNIIYSLAYNSVLDEILIGGSFTTYKGATANKFASLNSTDATLASSIDFNNTVIDIYYTEEFIIVGGVFTLITGGTSINANLIPIGATYSLTADNTETNLTTNNNIVSGLTISRYQDATGPSIIEGVSYVYEFDDDEIVQITNVYQTNGRVEIEIFNESLNLQDIIEDVRVRSPKFYKSQTEIFDTTQFKIWAYTGDVFGFNSIDPIYTKTKQKISPLQDTIFINWSDLTRDNIEANINSYINGNSSVQPLISSESKWVRIEAENFITGTTVDDSFGLYFISDGYIESTEIQGLPNILTTGNKKYYNSKSTARIYFKTNRLLSINIDYGLLSQTIDMTTEIGQSTDWVQSLKLNLLAGNQTVTFNYSTGNEVVVIETYGECKYQLYDLVFKNKYGMLETISMSKLSKKTIETEKQTYNRSIVNLNGEYDVARHSNKDLNVTGKESWLLNSGWVPEYLNAQFEEMMLSEEVWMVKPSENSGFVTTVTQTNLIPITIKESNFEYKTAVNDKLINYTINVELSHEKINNLI
jgi:hypothetical protein